MRPTRINKIAVKKLSAMPICSVMRNDMANIKIKLPPLPEWMTQYSIPSDRFGDDVILEDRMQAYARTAIEADRKHFAELFMDLSRYAAGMYEQECDSHFNGLSDGYRYAAEFLIGKRNAVDEIEANRKRRGEPVGYILDGHLEMLKRGQYANIGPIKQGGDVAVYLSPQPQQIPEGQQRTLQEFFAALDKALALDKSGSAWAHRPKGTTGERMGAWAEVHRLRAMLEAAPANGEES